MRGAAAWFLSNNDVTLFKNRIPGAINMKLLTLLATAVSILLPVACNMFSTEPVKKEFLNTPWQLESFVTGGDIIKPPADQPYQISFTSDSTWEGRSDCNEIFGGYQLPGGSS